MSRTISVLLTAAALVSPAASAQTSGAALSPVVPSREGVDPDGVRRIHWPHVLDHPLPPAASPVFEIPAQERGSRSPGWARFLGGFLTGTATLAGLYVLDEDDLPEAAAYGLYLAGTAAGTGVATLFWERPRPGILVGAAVGALPLIAALTIENDDAAGLALLAAWIAAPLGASKGQR